MFQQYLEYFIGKISALFSFLSSLQVVPGVNLLFLLAAFVVMMILLNNLLIRAR